MHAVAPMRPKVDPCAPPAAPPAMPERPGRALPGTTKPRRFRPRFHYELLACGLAGHELVGTDAARLRPQDATVARQGADGVRWHRCLRCDSWLPLAGPEHPSRPVPPDRDEVELPLRGKALRDKVVLRLIAIDRALHAVVLTVLAVAIFVFAANQPSCAAPPTASSPTSRAVSAAPPAIGRHGLLARAATAVLGRPARCVKIGVVVAVYALLEGVEAVGLWLRRRRAGTRRARRPGSRRSGSCPRGCTNRDRGPPLIALKVATHVQNVYAEADCLDAGQASLLRDAARPPARGGVRRRRARRLSGRRARAEPAAGSPSSRPRRRLQLGGGAELDELAAGLGPRDVAGGQVERVAGLVRSSSRSPTR